MKALLLAVLVCACGPASRDTGDGLDASSGVDGAGSGSGSGSDDGMVYVYAHTATELFRVDPDTLAITSIGQFVWPSGTDEMTDIAIDKTGQMIGVSFTSVYRVDPTNAHTTLLSPNLAGSFNGLSFVPATQLGQTGDDVLVGTRNTDGMVFSVDPMTGATMPVGNMGAFTSSGDLVAVEGFGTVQTVTGTTNDRLARLAPQTFAATPIGTDTGFGQIWGVAFWKNKIYGFTNGGAFILIDPTTGVATLVSNTGMSWYGAAVTTLAPVIQ
jgi:large repetitive protein